MPAAARVAPAPGPFSSKTVTRNPAAASSRAAEQPTMPAPTIATSVVSGIWNRAFLLCAPYSTTASSSGILVSPRLEQ